LFTDWITTGNTVESIAHLTKTNISSRQLVKYFDVFLLKTLVPKASPTLKNIHLKIDAKYFGKWGCCIVCKEGKNIIFWHFCFKETYKDYLFCFSRLRELNYVVLSVTSDMHSSIKSAVKTFYPNIPHQACLVHIQRRCQTLLTKKPDTIAGKQLLDIVININQIKSQNDVIIFKLWLDRFEQRYYQLLNKRSYVKDTSSPKKWWYTHKNLRKCFRHLKNSLPNMFHYLENPDIPKDTNGLEAEFTHLKTKLNIHRGLKRYKRVQFINWYWYLKSTQKFN